MRDMLLSTQRRRKIVHRSDSHEVVRDFLLPVVLHDLCGACKNVNAVVVVIEVPHDRLLCLVRLAISCPGIFLANREWRFSIAVPRLRFVRV